MKNTQEQSGLIQSHHGTLDVIGLPAFDDNLIWLLRPHLVQDTTAVPVTVVDPGDASPVIDYCRRNGLIPSDILLTHHHADHTGGVSGLLEWLQERYPDHPVRVFGPLIESIPGVTHSLQGNELLTLGCGVAVSVLSVPGHTRGHLAYFMDSAPGVTPPALFSGDLLFGLGCGRLFEGTAAQMHAALLAVSALPDNTRIYCAHEYTLLNLPFALHVDPHNTLLKIRAAEIRALRQAGRPTLPLELAVEKATNPFLRADVAEVAAAVCPALEMKSQGFTLALEVFTRLRAMRDTFKAS
jgi:hydroxyacylglutathione hydrolase